MKKFLFLILAFALPLAWGTTFSPIAFDKQLREADGAIEGKFLGASTIRNSDDEVFTQATFLVKRVVGFSQGQIANNQRLVVIYPGGVWQGINYSVQGSPRFKENEEVFLILTKTQQGYTLNNLSLGKYRIEHSGAEKHLVSEVFPEDENLGHIPFSKVEQAIHQVFRKSFDEISNDKHISMEDTNHVIPQEQVTKAPGRSIASVESDSPAQPKGMRAGFWLGFLFGILGLLSVWFARQRH